MKKVVRKIEVALSTEEIADLGENAARMQKDYFKREMEFADYKKNEKRRIDDLKAIVMDTLKAIDKGTKEIDVECEEVPNLFDKEFEYYHDGEIADRRRMTFEEFDSLVEKMCEKKVNEDNYNYEYYFENKLVIARLMTSEQIEDYNESQRGQKTLALEK